MATQAFSPFSSTTARPAEPRPNAGPKRPGMRDQSMKVLADALSEGAGKENTRFSPSEAAEAIENVIFAKFPDEKTKDYRLKLRGVAVGLKGPRAENIRAAVLHGVLPPEDFITLEASAIEQKAKSAVAKLLPMSNPNRQPVPVVGPSEPESEQQQISTLPMSNPNKQFAPVVGPSEPESEQQQISSSVGATPESPVALPPRLPAASPTPPPCEVLPLSAQPPLPSGAENTVSPSLPAGPAVEAETGPKFPVVWSASVASTDMQMEGQVPLPEKLPSEVPEVPSSETPPPITSMPEMPLAETRLPEAHLPEMPLPGTLLPGTLLPGTLRSKPPPLQTLPPKAVTSPDLDNISLPSNADTPARSKCALDTLRSARAMTTLHRNSLPLGTPNREQSGRNGETSTSPLELLRFYHRSAKAQRTVLPRPSRRVEEPRNNETIELEFQQEVKCEPRLDLQDELPCEMECEMECEVTPPVTDTAALCGKDYLDESVQELRRKLHEAQMSLAQAEREAEANKCEAAQLGAELQELKKEGDGTECCSDELFESHSELEELKNDGDETKHSSDGLSEGFEDVSVECDALRCERERLLTTEEACQSQHRIEIEELNHMLRSAHNSAEQLQEDEHNLEKQCAQLECERVAQKELVNSLERERDNLVRTVADAAAFAAAAMADVEGVCKDELCTLQRETRSLEVEFLATHDALAAERTTSRDMAAAHRNEVASLQIQKHTLETSVESLQQELYAVRRDRRHKVLGLLERSRAVISDAGSPRASTTAAFSDLGSPRSGSVRIPQSSMLKNFGGIIGSQHRPPEIPVASHPTQANTANMMLDASRADASLERFEDGRSALATQAGSFSQHHVMPKNVVTLAGVISRDESTFLSGVPDSFGGGCSADLNIQPVGLPGATPTPPRTQGLLKVPQPKVSPDTPIPAQRTLGQFNVPQPKVASDTRTPPNFDVPQLKVSTFSDASRPKASAIAQAGDVSSLFD